MNQVSYVRLLVGAAVAFVLVSGTVVSAKTGVMTKVTSKVGKVLGATTKTKCLNGEIVSMSKKALAVKYAHRGKVVTKTLRMTAKQFSVAGNRSIRKGSPIKVCSKDNWKSVAGNLINRAPKGQEETYGNVDGGGGGGGSSGT